MSDWTTDIWIPRADFAAENWIKCIHFVWIDPKMEAILLKYLDGLKWI